MKDITAVVLTSILTAGLSVAIGGIMPAKKEGDALVKAIESIARQPEQTGNIIRLFILGAAFIESIAIYVLVIALIILFANPFIHLFTG
ncbi:MAG: ATP synthase F0 subunit C [Aquifex sp.]|nr:MAG: ATP synthase F0 subunit C [Aquifex sp.]